MPGARSESSVEKSLGIDREQGGDEVSAKVTCGLAGPGRPLINGWPFTAEAMRGNAKGVFRQWRGNEGRAGGLGNDACEGEREDDGVEKSVGGSK